VVQLLDQYLTEVQHTSANMAPTNATPFWKQKSAVYSLLAPVAEERITPRTSITGLHGAYFSVCSGDSLFSMRQRGLSSISDAPITSVMR